MTDIAELVKRARELLAGLPPGPWQWYGNTKFQDIYLSTVSRGREFIMRFSRWGFHNAQPLFQVYRSGNGVMETASSMAKYEVANVIGDKAAKDSPDLYRHDFIGIEHPAAILFAESSTIIPQLADAIESLAAENEKMREAIKETLSRDGQFKHGLHEDLIDQLKAAIGEA